MTSDNDTRPRRRSKIRSGAARVARTIRNLLASPNALAAAALVAVLALGLALYVVFAQINLTNCLAKYNEASANATAARSVAASEDRATDLQERNLAETERARQAENDAALDRILVLLSKQSVGAASQQEINDAFVDLLNVRNASARIRSANQVKRAELAQRRADTDARRRASPVPDPPSTMCGGESAVSALLSPITGG